MMITLIVRVVMVILMAFMILTVMMTMMDILLLKVLLICDDGGDVGRAWLAQLVRSLTSDHKVPSSIPGSAEI